MKIVVLGAGGMLGSMVASEVASSADLEAVCTLRDPAALPTGAGAGESVSWRTFDAENGTLDHLVSLLGGASWAVNAIGVIKPYIEEDTASVERAIRVNALFPQKLARAAEDTECRVLQIATDCVFAGTGGGYAEDDPHDALDTYGKTKSLGEARSPFMHHLRCSIVGPELRTRVSLLEWFRHQPKEAVLRGFMNHRWNGVTTLHFARLCVGMMECGTDLPGLHHVVPSGCVTKKELLDCLAREYGRGDLTINPAEADVAVDRTLATRNDGLNRELWRQAGYKEPPTVATMVREIATAPEPRGIVQ